MAARTGALILTLVAWASGVTAHPAPYSYVDLHLESQRVRGIVVVHVYDVAHELSLPDADEVLDAQVAERLGPALAALLSQRLSIEADGQSLELDLGRLTPEPERHGASMAFDAATASAGHVRLSTLLFPYNPQHQTFVNVYEGGRLRHQAILDAGRTTLDYYAGTTDGIEAVLATFVPTGIHHIMIGPDHVLFLVALMVLGGTLTRLLTIVTAFTLGHSITLSLAATGVIMPPASIVEPAIALSIVVVGVDNLLVGQARDRRDLRPWAALAFGLVHGFGFASVLREFGLPPTALGWSLFSFNLGVELGQIAIVVVVAGLLMALRRRNAELAQRVAVAASVAVIVAGSWWFAERVFA